MAWSKIKFFYANSLPDFLFGVTSTESTGDYDVMYLFNMKETDYWQAAASEPQYIQFDAGAGNTYTADYIAIAGHNLAAAGAQLELQHSTDGFFWSSALTYTPANNRAFVVEFTQIERRWWRVQITNSIIPVYMAICIWGVSTELDYASVGFDPHGFKESTKFNISEGGYVAGVHVRYSERTVNLTFNDADSTLYSKIKTWRDVSGLKNFFLGWEVTNNPTDIFLMRPDVKFNNPFVRGGLYRNITLKLRGRMEV